MRRRRADKTGVPEGSAIGGYRDFNGIHDGTPRRAFNVGHIGVPEASRIGEPDQLAVFLNIGDEQNFRMTLQHVSRDCADHQRAEFFCKFDMLFRR